jgi:hypothetical protein
MAKPGSTMRRYAKRRAAQHIETAYRTMAEIAWSNEMPRSFNVE